MLCPQACWLIRSLPGTSAFLIGLNPEEAGRTFLTAQSTQAHLDTNTSFDITSDGIRKGNEPNPNCQELTCVEVQCPPPALRTGQEP